MNMGKRCSDMVCKLVLIPAVAAVGTYLLLRSRGCCIGGREACQIQPNHWKITLE